MVWLSVILMAVAVSFDAFAIGVSYGMNKISVSACARFILSLVSGCTMLIAMLLGSVFGRQLSARSANSLGGLILIFIGIYTIWRNYRPSQTPRVLINLRIPLFGLIIQVFQEPLKADYDQSQHISFNEALVLGAALALDALAAGFGAAVLGLPLLPTAAAAFLASYLFISHGLWAGSRITSKPNQSRQLRWFPGTLIFLIGLQKIFF